MADFSFASLGVQPAPTPEGAAPAPGSLFAELGVAPGTRRPSMRAAQDIGDSIRAGWQSNSGGLLLRGKMPDIELPTDAPWHHRLASGVGAVAADFVPGVAGALAGSVAGPVGAFAGGNAVPMALRDALVRAYENNYATTWEGVFDIGMAALKGGAKGAAIGAATGGAGKLVGGAMAASGVGARTAATLGAEVTAMTTTAAALEGRLPTAQEFMDSAILLGGLRGAVATARKLRNIYAETGKHPAEVAAEAASDPAVKAAVLAADDPKALPEPYRALALEERVKAALDTDRRPELARALMEEASGKPNPTAAKDLVRYDYITDRETFEATVRHVVDVFGDQIERQRRETVPTKQSIAEGTALIESGKLREHKIGEAGNAAEVAARAFLLRGAMERAKDLGESFHKTPVAERSVGQHLQVLAAVEQAGMFYKDVAGMGAEIGRALNMFGQLKRNTDLLGQAKMLLDSYNKNGKDVGSLTSMLKSMKDPEQMAKFASELNEATTLQKVLAVYRANLFSGLMTHIANPLGNLTAFAVETVTAPIAATYSAILKAGTKDALTMAQWKARAAGPWIGMSMGAKDGVIAAGEVLRGKLDAASKAESTGTANKGVLGKYEALVFRSLSAEDMLFRVPAERQKAYIMAVDRAVKEGFNPETSEGQHAIVRYTNQPQYGLDLKAAQDVTAAIEKAGSQAVFAEQLGPRNLAFQRAISGSPLQFIFPAYRTPVNLLSWAMQHAPGLNFLSARWMADFKAGGDSQAKALARVTVGAGLAATAYALAESGILTGSGIYDKEQSGTKRAAGWQPNSIRIGDDYYSFERIEPVAKILTIAADLVEISQVTKDEDDKWKIAMMLIMGFGNATVSTTYLSGLANTLKAITDPQRNAENWFEGYAASIVPKFIGQGVTLADPHKREIDGVLDAIQGQLPFLREKLLPKRDVWGEPVQNNRWFDVMPVTVTEASKELVRTEAMRLQLAIMDAPRYAIEKGPFKQKDRDIKLSPEQRDIMREVGGKAAMAWLAPVVNSPDWKQLPDYVQAKIYQRVLENAHKQGAFAALPPEAAERAAMQQKVLGKIIEQEQAVSGR